MNLNTSRFYLLDNGVLVDLSKYGLQQGSAINDAGQVTGYDCSGPNKCGMAVWQNGRTKVILPERGPQFPSTADVNAAGHVAGLIGNFGGGFQGSAGILVANSNVVLMGLDGNDSGAQALNDIGQVVGNGYAQWNIARHAFLLYSAGVTTDLGTLGGFNSSAADINNAGQVVGSSDISFFEPDQHAILWQKGSMIDLALLPEVQAAGWDSLASASAINERGQIVGCGIRGGVGHGFLLTPVPEPETWTLLLLGLVLLGLRMRSQSPTTT